MKTRICLVVLLATLSCCTDDLGLESSVFACDPDRPCANGRECVAGRCVGEWDGPTCRVRLRLRADGPAAELESGLCSRATLCYSLVGKIGLRGCVERVLEQGEAAVEYDVPSGQALCVAVACSPASAPAAMTGRNCSEGFVENQEVPILLMPVRAFGPVPGVSGGGFVSPGMARTEAVVLPLQDGRILVAGGRLADGTVTASVEVFDPFAASFASPEGGGLNQARARAAGLVLASGEVAVFGGEGSDGQPLSTVEVFDPVGGGWSPGLSMAAGRSHHTATHVDGAILIAGGKGEGGSYWELWEPDGGTFLSGVLQEPRYNHTATSFGAADGGSAGVVLAGGQWWDVDEGVVRSTIEVLKSHTGQWGASVHPLGTSKQGGTPLKKTLHMAVLVGRQVFLLGGFEDWEHTMPVAEICGWDPDEAIWAHAAGQFNMLQPRAGATATRVATEEGVAFLMAGGVTIDQNGQLSAIAGGEWMAITEGGGGKEVLDLGLPLGTMYAARWGHEAAAMQDGRVFLFGGKAGDPLTDGVLVESIELFNP